jgi:hypothetical protein
MPVACGQILFDARRVVTSQRVPVTIANPAIGPAQYRYFIFFLFPFIFPLSLFCFFFIFFLLLLFKKQI